MVYDRLEDILKLCSSSLTKDGKFVVQKYIERPLLIHNTKFDIRQWFLVTDWNPLTIWMFKDCYLRFCTEHFSLETRQQNVHLCNHSIQKNYKNNSNRHTDLPGREQGGFFIRIDSFYLVENMWTNTEFIAKYLRPNHLADRWDKYIYPAMKDAIICSMLVAQDTIDQRKVLCHYSTRGFSLVFSSDRIHSNYLVLILCSEKILNPGSLKSIVVRRWRGVHQ